MMGKVSEIVGLMIFGAILILIASNKTARSIMSNASLPGMLAKTKKQKEKIEARTKVGFLTAGITMMVVAFIFLARHLWK